MWYVTYKGKLGYLMRFLLISGFFAHRRMVGDVTGILNLIKIFIIGMRERKIKFITTVYGR